MKAGDGRRKLIGELFVAEGPDAGHMLVVHDGAAIGRDTTADITLTDGGGSLSRTHARFRLEGGTVLLEDLGSTNGTFVNGERLTGPRALAPHDRIGVGDSVLDFTPAPELGVETAARPIPDAATTAARPVPQTPPTPVAQATRIGRRPPPVQTPPPEPGPVLVRPEPEPTFAPAGADGQLFVISGPGVGTAVPVKGSATIGREPECELQVPDGEVSRRHAKVVVRDGVATLDDLGSANGTYVNGERILAPRRLLPKDRIQIGEATLVFTSPVLEGAVARPAPVEVTGIRDMVAKSPELLSGEDGNRKWWTLAMVLVAAFMLLLDVTIVGVALPSISDDLKPSFTSLQWIVDAYSLMLTVVLLTAGSLADIFGRKRLLMIGLIIFTGASVLCAQAPSATFLALMRGVQGIGGAVMYSCLLALIVQEFPAKERAMAFGLYGAVNAIAVAMGPIIGGVLVEVFGWQSIFYLNVPIGITTLLIVERKVVNLRGPETSVDYGGLVTFMGAIFLAVFATIRGNDEGWTSGVILGCYGGAIVLFAAFVAIELRRSSPMLDLRLFKNPTFVGSSVSGFTLCFSAIALIFFFTTWFQSILGYSAIGTGVRMLAFAGVGLACGPIAGRMTQTVDPRFVLTLSLTLSAAGALSMTGVDADSEWTAILPGLILSGTGLGLIGPTLAATSTGVVPPWRSGMAGAMNSTMRQLGTTAGIAVLGTLLQHQVTQTVRDGLSGSFLDSGSKGIANAIASGGARGFIDKAPKDSRDGLRAIAREAYSAGLSHIFIAAFIVAAIGAVTAFALVRKHHMRTGPPGGPPGSGPPGGRPPGAGPPT